MKIKKEALFYNLILEAIVILLILMFFIVRNFDTFSSLIKEINTSYPELSENPIIFNLNTFCDTDNDDALYGLINYNGRDYIPYGVVGRNYSKSVIDDCVGYIVQEDDSEILDSRRIYTLKDSDDFLFDYDKEVKIMNSSMFFRAIDTKDKDIVIPKYIDSLGYEFWD